MRNRQSLEESRKEIFDTIVRIPADFRGNFLLSPGFVFVVSVSRPFPAQPDSRFFPRDARVAREIPRIRGTVRGIRYVCRKRSIAISGQ